MKRLLETPIGTLMIEADGGYIVGIYVYKPERDADAAYTAPQNETEAADCEVLAQCRRELNEYFAGTRKEFHVPTRADGTAYRRHVWQELKRIQYGEVISYKELAARTGNPKASRAVGGANRVNPLMIIVPCHRVIGANGAMTGYGGGGVGNKQWLLDHERKHKVH